MLSTPILLDYQSSTPCSKDVVDSMKPFWSERFSNPASKSNIALALMPAKLDLLAGLENISLQKGFIESTTSLEQGVED